MFVMILDQAYTNVNVIQSPVITTKGWDVQVKWRIKSLIGWVTMNLIKESNPIEVAEHAMDNG